MSVTSQVETGCKIGQAACNGGLKQGTGNSANMGVQVGFLMCFAHSVQPCSNMSQKHRTSSLNASRGLCKHVLLQVSRLTQGIL